MLMDLNILSLKKEWLEKIPEGSILTPHPKEFERLAGKTENSYNPFEQDRLSFQKFINVLWYLKGA